MDSNFLQSMFTHIHSESFGRFFVSKLSINFAHLVILNPKYAPPNWPSSRINNGLQLSSGHDAPHPFREFFAVVHHLPLPSFLAHLVILPPNMHDQDDLPQNQQWTPTSFRGMFSPTSNPRVLAGFAWVSHFHRLCSLGDFSTKYGMDQSTSPKINNFLQLSSGLDVPHPFREFFAVVHHLPLHLFWLTWWF